MTLWQSGHCESWAPSRGPTTQLTTAVRTVGHSGRCMLRGIQCAEGSAYMDCYPPFRLCTIQSWAGSHACFPSILYSLFPPLSPLLFRVSPPSPLLLSCSNRRRLLHNFHTGTYHKIFWNKNQCLTVAGICCRLVIQVYGRLHFGDGLTLIHRTHLGICMGTKGGQVF